MEGGAVVLPCDIDESTGGVAALLRDCVVK